MIATSDFLIAIECTKFFLGRGSAPDPAGGAYSAPPDPLAGLRGPTSKGRGRGGEGGERKGKRGGGRGEEGEGGGIDPPIRNSWIRPWMYEPIKAMIEKRLSKNEAAIVDREGKWYLEIVWAVEREEK